MKIPIQDKSSVTEEIEIELGKYTILAGENNSGKTNVIKGIYTELGADNVIYIPAENIDANDAIKNSASGDPMRQAISKLLDIVLDGKITIKGGLTGFLENLKENFDSFGIEKTSLLLNPEDFEKEDMVDMLKDAIVAKILKPKILDKYGSDKKIDVKSVGQGIQRIIIASVIQELGKLRLSGRKIVLLFEEPEIYLHPRLKEKLYQSLLKLSEQPNVAIVITTHDPYFIELGKDLLIYRVFRDPDSLTNATKCKPFDHKKEGYLGYRSHSEINYLIFGLASSTYFLELYEKLKNYFKSNLTCERCLKPTPSQYTLMNDWLKSNNANMVSENEPRLSKLRHSIGHSTKTSQKYIVEEKDIQEAIKFIEAKEKETQICV
ncbi:MAG: AAA family ATPase [Minisyncoccia bacterium]